MPPPARPASLADLFPLPTAEPPAHDRPWLGALPAQRFALLDRFAAYALEQDLRPGDLVVPKPGLAPGGDAPAGRALLLWRLLDPADPLDAAVQADAIRAGRSDRPDCLLASLADDGRSLLLTPFDRARLAPLPEAERAGLAAILAGA